ncbi:hypothetical protein NYF23_12465 [SAR92 clade bacterium H455]|uniref:Uncharacterized protein n=1 Tax=SAR92 clade bacterium H455 TaxID=2974818 RepID=A0ABY5TR83_9GAMM|nr:hypothetical protein NYF23_12465 [SAR92 clade bacterium H455]
MYAAKTINAQTTKGLNQLLCGSAAHRDARGTATLLRKIKTATNR